MKTDQFEVKESRWTIDKIWMIVAVPIKLTSKQKLFCKYYLIRKNATWAAKKSGYSNHSSAAIGLENLRKPLIRKYIAAQIKKQNERLDMDADDVIRSIARIALADPRDLFDDDDNLKPISEWGDEVALAVSSVEIVNLPDGQTKVFKVKHNDRIKALEQLARHQSLFKDININLNVDENTDVDQFNDKLDRIISAVQSGGK